MPGRRLSARRIGVNSNSRGGLRRNVHEHPHAAPSDVSRRGCLSVSNAGACGQPQQCRLLSFEQSSLDQKADRASRNDHQWLLHFFESQENG
jgi:hypothetical protein